ncbi:prostaglandin reductase 3-like [Ixodes scapularis]|uniref:prostaglandin reductase 3-like n=1 Tax=Ixodes scapularis TaxID=6945 RepID=UPI001A9E3D14|nr:prostaglandin reductase 3-like [Ixodes scapularis]
MSLPKEYKKLACVSATPSFREAVSVIIEPMPELERDEVFLKTKYAGINASDVNTTATRCWNEKPPFSVGIESVAEVVAVGDGVKHLSIGSAVATINIPGFGAFSEYQRIPASEVFPIPRAVPEVIPLLISGLTAAIGLDEQGRIKGGEAVLITAAAGGLGHLAVQWAKGAKCHVIGTCSSQEKELYLKSIGCDKVINYRTQDLGAELDKCYPNGVDVVWETIGGKTFEVLLERLSIKGRLVVVGAITGFQGSDKAFPDVDLTDLPQKLLIRSASLSGFFLPQYTHLFSKYVARLQTMLQDGTIVPKVDFGLNADGGEFKGLDGCVRGVEYLHSGKSVGKVVVKIDESA